MEIGGQDAGSVRANDMVLIPPDVSQRITNTGTIDLVFLCVCTPRFQPGVYKNLEPALLEGHASQLPAK